MNHIARSCFPIEPLPQGALPVYSRDLEVADALLEGEPEMNKELKQVVQPGASIQQVQDRPEWANTPPHTCSDFTPPKKVKDNEHEETTSNEEADES